jgi:hypothetical protein
LEAEVRKEASWGDNEDSTYIRPSSFTEKKERVQALERIMESAKHH